MHRFMQVLKKNGSRFFATKEAIKKTMFGELLNRPADAEPLDSATVRSTTCVPRSLSALRA